MSLRLERQHCERELKRARKELKQTDEECKTQIADMQDVRLSSPILKILLSNIFSFPGQY